MEALLAHSFSETNYEVNPMTAKTATASHKPIRIYMDDIVLIVGSYFSTWFLLH